MTLQHWLDLCASDPAAANALCGDAMGWYLADDGSTWCRDGECLRGIEDWSPATRRDDAALMVKLVCAASYEINSAFRWTMGRSLQHCRTIGNALVNHFGIMRADEEDGSQWITVEDVAAILLADPALIAWACIEALKKEEA
jgi:hypothetical protein